MRIKLFFILIFLYFFTGCKAQENIKEERVLNETVSLLESYFNAIAEKKGTKVHNQILHNIDYKPWVDSLIPLQLWSIRNFNIQKKADVIDFENLFNETDITHFRSTSKTLTIQNWSEIINHPILSDTSTKGLLLSSPAFDKSFKHAIFYLEDSSSGSLILFKKENDQWVYFASGMVWIE